MLGGIVQKYIEEAPPSEVPHEAVSVPDALGDDFGTVAATMSSVKFNLNAFPSPH